MLLPVNYIVSRIDLFNNVVIATKGLQDRNINILAGTTVENKGKLILNIFGHCSTSVKPIFSLTSLRNS